MTILFVSDNYLPAINGITNHILTVTAELKKRGHRVIIVAPNFGDSAIEKDVLRLPSLPMPLRRGDRLTSLWSSKIESYLLGTEIDIVHSHLLLSGFLGLRIARKKKLPRVVTAHTSFKEYLHWILPWMGRASDPLASYAIRFYYNLFDAVIAPSFKTYEELKTVNVSSRIEVMPSGINLGIFRRATHQKFLQEFNLERQTPLVIMVGKLDPGKNVEIAVEAIGKVQKEIGNVKLAIIGDGVLRPKIEALIKNLKLSSTVFVTGFVDYETVASANKAAWTTLVLSEIDVLPTVAIEAAAAGGPIVALKDKAFRNVVLDKENGFLVKKEPEIIARAIIRILKDRRLSEAMGKKSLEIAGNFSIEKYVDKLEELYNKLISGRAAKISRIS